MLETFLIEILGETIYLTLVNQNPELLCVIIILFVFLILILLFSLIRSICSFGGKF